MKTPYLHLAARVLGATSIFVMATFLSAESAAAQRRVHLDVHRYCQTVFGEGGVWRDRQYTSNGWHRYHRRSDTHQCGFRYRSLSGFRRSHEKYEEVWLNKACREQNNNDQARAIQDGRVVWCILP